MSPDSLKRLFDLLRITSSAAVSPAGALVRTPTRRDARLAAAGLEALLVEVCARLELGETPASTAELIALADAACDQLAESIQVHENRFSRRRFHDLFWVFYRQLDEPRPPIAGATWLDVGCGPVNPLGMVFLMLMLGARRGVGVDLDPVRNPSRAARGLASLASAMFVDPEHIPCEFAVSREQLIHHLQDVSLPRLRSGDLSGVGPRLSHLQESASRLSLESGSVDVVISNSFLEHVGHVEGVIAEIARVTVRGGFGVHSIDGIDHASYGDRTIHPLDFLRRQEPGMVNESNRIRPLEFPAIFERHGLTVQQCLTSQIVPLTPEDVAGFAEPWRSMPRAWLEATTAVVVTRKA